MSTQVAILREVLEQRFPDAVPSLYRQTAGIATGVYALDRALPNGGLPRGRLSAWARSVGSAALLRAACLETVRRGERVAWIDAERTVCADVSWAGVAVVRPEKPRDALFCAEELLRCGGFALVILLGAESQGTERLRLCRAAREGGSALVESSAQGYLAAVRIQSWAGKGALRWERSELGEPIRLKEVRVRVRATALGWSQEAEVSLAVTSHVHRMSLEPSLASRRGTPG
ncbi:MAG: hypothetical protein ACREKN_09915 [Longimicrobiaceae bacterium]